VLDIAVVVMDSAVAVLDTVVELEVLTDGRIVPPCADTLIMVPFCFSFFGFDLVRSSVVLLSRKYRLLPRVTKLIDILRKQLRW